MRFFRVIRFTNAEIAEDLNETQWEGGTIISEQWIQLRDRHFSFPLPLPSERCSLINSFISILQPDDSAQ